MQQEFEEGGGLTPDARLFWIRARDALHQHGERHLGADEGWWELFGAFEAVARRLVQPGS